MRNLIGKTFANIEHCYGIHIYIYNAYISALYFNGNNGKHSSLLRHSSAFLFSNIFNVVFSYRLLYNVFFLFALLNIFYFLCNNFSFFIILWRWTNQLIDTQKPKIINKLAIFFFFYLFQVFFMRFYKLIYGYTTLHTYQWIMTQPIESIYWIIKHLIFEKFWKSNQCHCVCKV